VLPRWVGTPVTCGIDVAGEAVRDITSLNAYNLAKISLAQAIGVAEQSALTYLGAK
jgi:hypothetical protein